MAPPHFQGSVGGGRSCAQRTSLMLSKKPSKLGFLRSPTGYHPNYFLQGCRAFSASQPGPRAAGPPPGARVCRAHNLQSPLPTAAAGARTSAGSWKKAENMGRLFNKFGVFPSKENQCTLFRFGALVAGAGLCLPMCGGPGGSRRPSP